MRIIPLLVGGLTTAFLGLAACSNPADSGEQQEQQQGSADIVEAVQADDELSAMLPEDNRTSGKITVSINPDVEPIKFLDSEGEISGLNPDLLRAAGRVLGVDVEFQQGTFDAMVPGLESRRYDVIASIGDYKERQVTIDFIDYLKTGDGILAAADLEQPVTSPEDLCGLRVGYARGTSQQGDLEAAAKSCEAAGEETLEVNGYQEAAAGVLAVKSGEADAFWGDLPSMLYNEQENPDIFKVVYKAQDSYYGIGIHKEDAELRDALRAALLSLAEDGVYAELLTQWAQDGYGLPEFPVNAGGPLEG